MEYAFSRYASMSHGSRVQACDPVEITTFHFAWILLCMLILREPFLLAFPLLQLFSRQHVLEFSGGSMGDVMSCCEGTHVHLCELGKVDQSLCWLAGKL